MQELQESFGEICRGERERRGRSFSNWIRNGCAGPLRGVESRAAWAAKGRRVSQRLLPAEFCDALRNDSLAHRAGARKKFLPRRVKRFQRRAAELALLVREAFLRGTSTRQVGRVVATLMGEPVRAKPFRG